MSPSSSFKNSYIGSRSLLVVSPSKLTMEHMHMDLHHSGTTTIIKTYNHMLFNIEEKIKKIWILFLNPN